MKVLDHVSMLLRNKGTNVYSVRSDASVLSAIQMLADRGIGALLVIDNGRLVGILSERDYARKVILKGRSSNTTTVGEIMTPSPITIRGDETVDHAMHLMTNNRIRHLPVVDSGGELTGVLSIGDVVNWIVTSQTQTIEQLQTYITGSLAT